MPAEIQDCIYSSFEKGCPNKSKNGSLGHYKYSFVKRPDQTMLRPVKTSDGDKYSEWKSVEDTVQIK